MTTAPKYMSKHPCTACDTGYGFCAQWAIYNKKCCKDCAHPTRWESNPWTEEDLIEIRMEKSK